MYMKILSFFLIFGIVAALFLSVSFVQASWRQQTTSFRNNTYGQMKFASWSWTQLRTNQSNHLNLVATGTLSSQETQDLLYSYSEEKLARDVYLSFYEKYKLSQFKTIADSEQQHMDSVKTLLDRYGLTPLADYGTLNDTYKTLTSEGNVSLQKALEVGMKIEMLDIEDITKIIERTDNDDIKIVLVNIGGASYNHLKSFVVALKLSNLTTSIDYSAYLTQDDLMKKGYELKEKLRTRLTSEWVTLPASTQGKMNQGKINSKGGNHRGGMQNAWSCQFTQ